MKSKFLVLILGLALAGCGTKTQEIVVDGAPGQDGISMGIDVSSTAPGCLAGGSTIKTFVDSNRNGDLDTDETIKKVTVICNDVNGINGNDGIDGTSVSVATASSSQCPTGGIIVSTELQEEYYICNGKQGDIGPTGPSGGVGNLTPVQLCPGDTATFKEYGFIVGSDLFAVYFDKNQPIAFLAKLNPGNYVTTNGSNCQFTYANNGSTITLSNGNGTTTVNLNSSGSNSNTLAGQCSVVKFKDFQSEQQFHFAVTGMASYSSYTLEVTFNNGSTVNQVQDSNGGASTYVNPLYTIAPQNLANGFDFYAKHNGNVVNKPTVASAKVKKNGQEMTCTVSN